MGKAKPPQDEPGTDGTYTTADAVPEALPANTRSRVFARFNCHRCKRTDLGWFDRQGNVLMVPGVRCAVCLEWMEPLKESLFDKGGWGG